MKMRKYFLGVEITYPDEFLDNWKSIKNQSSQDKERNFMVYQVVKLFNKKFEVILVDDGSTDNSFSIAKKFKSSVKSYRFKNKKPHRR